MIREETKASLTTAAGTGTIYRLDRLSPRYSLSTWPFSMRVMLEAVLRNADSRLIRDEELSAVTGYNPSGASQIEIPFIPARVILQDFTGVPAIVDLAAMRNAMRRLGGNPARINPLVPVDLVIDHSVQVDHFAHSEAFERNTAIEFDRNKERYQFLNWGQQAFQNFRVVPPGTGIVHQVNLEYLAKVVIARDGAFFPDTLVGTDSHTTMINGLGVVGWGVGGIEAEASMLGQPMYMTAPDVIGFRLSGSLREGVTGTDLVLAVTEVLRRKGVVGKFVEFCGSALDALPLPIRAMIANMAPEYGATIGFFPVDHLTLDYLKMTGRTGAEIDLVERYCKEQGLFRTRASAEPTFSDLLTLDLSSIEPAVAGPKRPQDRVPLRQVKSDFAKSLTRPIKEQGYELPASDLTAVGQIDNGVRTSITHGAVVIAAITSCTNTSDPFVMLAAGLLAKKAAGRGLCVPSYVKTSLAPGSRVVVEYLRKAGVMSSLEQLGFHLVGIGCTTCIGNSGPLPEPVAKAITDGNIVAAAVLSGNRNFEGRVNPHTRANYLASPPLVVAYALAGTIDIDLTTQPVGIGSDGVPVMLSDIWPGEAEVNSAIAESVSASLFQQQYASVFDGNPNWNAISGGSGDLYQWQESSTYIQEPPFFQTITREVHPIRPIAQARVLVSVGDSVTTDHISPAGAIKKDSPAGRYLSERGVAFDDFNSYGSRRGNDRVMTRGTFANIRLRNLLVPGSEGNITRHFPSGEQLSIYDASVRYQRDGVPLVVLAGKDYGMGSSRDWAAKGTLLLGVRAVIAQSFERIHRSNLVGMGVLPLQFVNGESRESLGLTGEEVFSIDGLNDSITPMQQIPVRANDRQFTVLVRIDTNIEVDYYRHGGVLPMVLRQLLQA